MNKIKLIVSREYLTRVRKKSFLVMSILGPILFAAMFILPAWFASMEDKEMKTIAVVDSSHLFINKLPETEYIKFDYIQNSSVKEIRKSFDESGYYAILYIAHIVTYEPSAVQLYSVNQPSFDVESHIARSIEDEVKKAKLEAAGIDEETLKSIETDIRVRTILWTEDGEEKESSTEITTILAYVGGFLIYMFIFMFGTMVMRGVIEEKTSRIVEVIVSSARPFQLMMGKIIGIAAVGLTQFLIWIVLTLGIVTVAKTVLFPELGSQNAQEIVAQDIMSKTGGDAMQTIDEMAEPSEVERIYTMLGSINYGLMLGLFVFYFLGGFLLYGSLFAAVGGAVDNETDTQQFMFPITIPLLLSIYILFTAANNPDGPLAVWASIIPFTSPIVMLGRIPFGVPDWQVAVSMLVLILTFILTTWFAGKIYRTGILMYGKKVNYKEIWKWIKYKY